MNQNLHVNKTNFHMKGFAPGLALKQRRNVTQKSPIASVLGVFVLMSEGRIQKHTKKSSKKGILSVHKTLMYEDQCNWNVWGQRKGSFRNTSS